MKKKNKNIVVGAVLLLVLVASGALAYTKFGGKPKETAQEEGKKKKRINEPVNVIAIEERPYIQIFPESDGHNVSLTIKEVKKPAESAEYELEYQAGSLLQGAFGELDLSDLPATEKILLGSCSAGGACTFHENVQGGTLVTRFTGPENYSLKSRWKYIDNKAGSSELASQDAMFQMTSKDLAKQRFVVIFNTAGYPKGLDGKPVSELYSLTTSGVPRGSGDLTIRAEQEGNLKIVGYDGTKWKEFETTTEGKMAKAKVELMELYTVIAK